MRKRVTLLTKENTVLKFHINNIRFNSSKEQITTREMWISQWIY